jgi:hypothetical protein
MSFEDLMPDGGEKKVIAKAARAGSPVHGMQSPEFGQFFNQLAEHIGRLYAGTKMAVVGDEEIGKTHFLTTVPRPLTIVITDNRFLEIMFSIFRRAHPKLRGKPMKVLIENFEAWLLDKEIYVHHGIVQDEDSSVPDYYASINQFKKVLKVVAKHVHTGTFAIDNTSDIRLWLNELVDKEARFVNEKTGQPYQFEWGAANAIVRGMTETFRQKKMHFVLTAHTKDKYGKGGKVIPGKTVVDWNRTTSGDLDFIMEGRKIYYGLDPDKQQTTPAGTVTDAIGAYKRAWFVRKATKWPEYTQLCGNQGIMFDMTWPKLRADVLQKIGFDIAEIQM